MDPSSRQQGLLHFVDSAQSTSDLHKLLDFCNMDAIKQFLREQMEQMETETLVAAHHKALPINCALSDNVTQHILSFDSFNRQRTVCKSWNDLQKQNERNTLRSAYQKVLETYSANTTGRTFIMHKNRSYLLEEERRNGFVGRPLHDFSDVWTICQHGDRILVHEGMYRLLNHQMLIGVHFIGVSPASTISFDGSLMRWNNFTFSNLVLKNCAVIVNSAKLDGCEIQLVNTIDVAAQGTLQLTRCVVRCMIRSIYPRLFYAIEINPHAHKLHIEGCAFKGFDSEHCLLEHHGDNEAYNTVQIKTAALSFDQGPRRPKI